MTASKAQELGGNFLCSFLIIDFSTCIGFKPSGTTTLYFSPNRDGNSDITFDGHTYSYVGFQAQGFRSEINGQPPNPTIVFDKASLLNNSAFVALWDQCTAQTKDEFFDARGATVQFFRAINNSTAQKTSVQKYTVEQANKITKNTIEYQLAVSLGIAGAGAESVQTLAPNRCSLRYRRWNATTNDFDYTEENAGGCPYGNPTTTSNWSAVPSFGIKWFNKADAELTAPNKNLDACSYTVKGCQLRFDPAENGLALPFTGLYSPNTLGKS